MKIALGTLFDSNEAVFEWRDWMDEDSDYVRLSEVIEVEFTMLPKEEVVPKQVEKIDEYIAEVRAEMGAKVAKLEERKAKLLAITHER